MSKKVLIISPYFPPSNAADMQRVRMSLPFFRQFGWECEVVAVDSRHSSVVKDLLLIQSVPDDIKVHYVDAMSSSLTSRFGVGSIALRSLWSYRKKVSELLKIRHYDLIYFSTTQFPVCILGPYWKDHFGIPYVIDMQDLWYSTYYDSLPKSQQPPKHWISGRMNKLMEPIAMKKVDGLISVSEMYLETLSERYERCKSIPKRVITFGASETDRKIANENKLNQPSVLPKETGKIRIVYVGRGGPDMKHAATLLFRAFKDCIDTDARFRNIHFYFIGTSYASRHEGFATIKPVGVAEGVGSHVTEMTDRIPFYQALNTLDDADALFVPGSDDPQYTASKIYPYMTAGKPLLVLFHEASSIIGILKDCKAGTIVTFNEGEKVITEKIKSFLTALINEDKFQTEPDSAAFEKYSALSMTRMQCELFNEVVK